jgi:hypothetical protein
MFDYFNRYKEDVIIIFIIIIVLEMVKFLL